jgi:hypothetical protein
MKSFSQFLQESYLSEEEADQLRLMKRDNKSTYNFTKNVGNMGVAKDPTPLPASKRLSPAAPEAPKTSPGQLEIPEPKKTQVSGQKFRNAGEARQGSLLTKSGAAQNFTGGRTPFVGTEPVKATKRLPEAPPKAPKTSPGQQVIRQTSNPPTTKALPPGQKGGNLATMTKSKPVDAKIEPVKVSDITPKQKALPAGKPPSGPKPSAALKGASTATTIASNAPKVGKLAKIGKLAGPASAALDTALSTADERSKGSGWARSLAKGATVAAGGLLGGTAGAIGGGGLLSAATGTAGAMAGGAAAEKAFDTVAGANAKERKAMATANRQRQAGTAVKGIGGKTTFDTKKNTMTTGVGSQRKTVGLAKTGVVQRGGQSVAGHLAYKGGKAVYKAGPSAQSLAKTSSNPLERIGRSLFAGAYKQSDAANAAKNLAKARQSDAARNKALGVKMKPGG